MWPRQPALLMSMLLLMTMLLACQSGRASSTLQPGEKELPFETQICLLIILSRFQKLMST